MGFVRYCICLATSLILSLTPLVVIELILPDYSKACNWTCSSPSLNYCFPGNPPFCPENNLMDCIDYFESPYLTTSCPYQTIKDCPVCTLYLVGTNWEKSNLTLSLPFYGFFISDITLENANYLPSTNQSISVSFGKENASFVPGIQNVTLRYGWWVYAPELIFHFDSVQGFPTILFISAITMNFSKGVYMATWFICWFVYFWILMGGSSLVICCCQRYYRKRWTEEHRLLLN